MDVQGEVFLFVKAVKYFNILEAIELAQSMLYIDASSCITTNPKIV